MSRVLTFCWREWRAQRSVLVAYTLLGLASLALGFLLAPEAWWQTDGRRALALSWFVALGVIGVLAFVAPALVRSEFGAKDDQFVRRMPGALLPSFGGKLLFLALVAAALPLTCLLAGEGFLLAIGQPWHDLFRWEHNGNVYFEWPWPAPWLGYAALLVPCVWACGTWLPGGRMALGGTILIVLVAGIVVVAALRQSPGIEQGIAWRPWLALVPVLGLAAAAVSWTLGRRGGGPSRSARWGLTVLAVGLAPPAAWFAQCASDYRHPDLQRLTTLHMRGVSTDARFVLATGAGHKAFAPVTVRVDLATGEAQQVGSIDDDLDAALQRASPSGATRTQRYWRLDRHDGRRAGPVRRTLLDLQTGARVAYDWDATTFAPTVPPAIAAAIAVERAQHTPLRAPGDVRVWFDHAADGRGDADGAVLVFASPDGELQRVPWPGAVPRAFRSIGHAVEAFVDEQRVRFDLTHRRVLSLTKWQWGFVVGGVAVFRPDRSMRSEWWRAVDGDDAQPVAVLGRARVHGLLDDEHLLCSERAWRQPPRLFLLRARDLTLTELVLPDAVARPGHDFAACLPFHDAATLLPRDAAGRVWLAAGAGNAGHYVLLDPATRTLTAVLPHDRSVDRWQPFAWPDVRSVLVRSGDTVLHIDVATGVRTQLFPR